MKRRPKKGLSISCAHSAHIACFDSTNKRVWGGSQWPLMAKVKVNRGPGGSRLAGNGRQACCPNRKPWVY